MSIISHKIYKNDKLTFSELSVGDSIYKYVINHNDNYEISGVINKIKEQDDLLEIDYTYREKVKSRIYVYSEYSNAIDTTNNSFVIYSAYKLSENELENICADKNKF
jgi:hypothetical protein